MSIHCTVPLLFNSAAALPSFFTHESPSTMTITATPTTTTPISSLFYILIVSVLLVHEIFTIPLHAHTAPISSTTQVFYLIIMVTLQLLWRFSHAFNITGCYAEIPQPLWQLRLFVFSGIVELILSVSVTAPTLIQLSISSTNRLHSTGRFLVTLQLLWKSHRSLFASSGRNHQWFLAVTL
jgi:hypothetical protein